MRFLQQALFFYLIQVDLSSTSLTHAFSTGFQRGPYSVLVGGRRSGDLSSLCQYLRRNHHRRRHHPGRQCQPQQHKQQEQDGNQIRKQHVLYMATTSSTELQDKNNNKVLSSGVVEPANVWEEVALSLVNVNANSSANKNDEERMKYYVQTISLLRIGLPSLAIAVTCKLLYPITGMTLAQVINDDGVFAVVSQDASQYIQNILTTSGLVFGLLVGQTFCTFCRNIVSLFILFFDFRFCVLVVPVSFTPALFSLLALPMGKGFLVFLVLCFDVVGGFLVHTHTPYDNKPTNKTTPIFPFFTLHLLDFHL